MTLRKITSVTWEASYREIDGWEINLTCNRRGEWRISTNAEGAKGLNLGNWKTLLHLRDLINEIEENTEAKEYLGTKSKLMVSRKDYD